MNFLNATLFWFIGLFITSFTLIPVVIIFRFAIPFTKDLEKRSLLVKDHGIVKKYLISTLILASIYLTLIFILSVTTNSGFRGFVGGSFFSLLFGILKTGKNKDNISDYIETNKRFLTRDDN